MNRFALSQRVAGPAAALILVALLLVACGQPGGSAATGGGSATASSGGSKPTIKLAENPWTGSSVNVYVAKELLEKQLGYTVEVVTIDENGQWPSMATGDLSASLEVWPSGHQKDVEQFIDQQKSVENLGELGVVGQISWYVPSYVVQEHPDLATWEGLKKPENAALFKTAESGSDGQFLAGDQSWVQYDEDIIKNLGLPLKVVRAGSEQAVLAAVDSAYSRKQPILFYFWTPHSIHAKYDLTPVKLPEYSAECYAKASSGGVDCGYPPDNLFKVAWSGLKDKAPEAYQLLKNMKYTNEDQISMIAAVELDKKSPEEAARAWIDQHQDTWKAWLPAQP